ncbi:hypothetical protein M413DRAFT_448306 [Hebeloma cylindrosporum]|uniref:NAD+ kinase n=1 Tax=Hebeloma cylindrosporum TaxID=76867 RepID=A0A0C2Y9U6_HEBCY|nr:hypothetical protein M413DRAFT_448306 [Hebeloma cylindrosporum h7]
MSQSLTEVHGLLSPDPKTFSTPPATGPALISVIPPSLSRRNSRPRSLHIDRKQSDWNPDVELFTSSDLMDGEMPPITDGSTTASSPPAKAQPQTPHALKAVNSPCFVHSLLDKGAQLTDGLPKDRESFVDSSVGVSQSLQHSAAFSRSSTAFSSQISTFVSSDEDEFAGSLTKRLVETAVSVREMSKELGRARVQSNIQNVLSITKARDNQLIKLTRQLALFLMLKKRCGSNRGLVVYVDSQLRHSKRFNADGIEQDHPELFEPFPRRETSAGHSVSSLSSTLTQKEDTEEGQLRYWTRSMCSHSPHLFDFVVTLGGDGTVLFTSRLFQRIVPPVLPFALGSLGFLTNFDFADHQAVMDSAIDNGIRVNLRMRFTCTVYRAVSNEECKRRKAVKKGETGEIMMKNLEKGGWEALESGWAGGFAMGGDTKCGAKDKEIMCFTTRPVESFEVLNDVVVDRGQSPYLSLLELFGDEHHMTTVQADGLTVATPTGSTAYSLSAGGSLVHPEIPAILITPICPHTLSFRPMLLPDSMELRICVPYNSRSTAWASFDGRGGLELKPGDHIKVTASKYPFPTVCADDQSTDWFHAISRTLKWNERERQKSFVVVEEPQKHAKRTTQWNEALAKEKPRAAAVALADEEEDERPDEEEEETFDIDDSSPVAESRVGEEKGSATRPTFSPTINESVKSRSRSASRGVDSPDRFASPAPHPPNVSPRHVGFQLPSGESSASSSPGSYPAQQEGTNDGLHLSPRHSNGKSPVPKDRDLDLETIKTPTLGSLVQGRERGYSRSRSSDQPESRAFAVWGHDESDSNTSDGES